MFGAEPYHGRDGPVPIERCAEDDLGPLDLALRQAATDLGYGWSPDMNAPDGTGLGLMACNSSNGARMTSNDCYLEPARQRDNLEILGDVLVDRVLFEGTRAIGVLGLSAQGPVELRAAEIILAAGAVHSPAILLRSGIGPADDLRSLGLPVVADLPVGRSAQEHLSVRLQFETAEGTGVANNGRHANTAFRYSSGLGGAGFNDMAIQPFNPPDPLAPNVAALSAWQGQVFSRGTLRLVSPEPTADPTIEVCGLEDDRDTMRLRDGVRRLFELLRHPAVAKLVASAPQSIDGASVDETMSDALVDDWMMRLCIPVAHLSSTCRMGRDDGDAVVDPDCRVYGVDGLRVVDVSIVPSVPRANTHLTAVMIGEYAAERMRSL